MIGSPPEFTANWSYTALSRAREPTEIYVIADEDRFAAERAEIAPPDQHARTPLQRMAMSMRRRDDEDLALDWIEPPELPVRTLQLEPERARGGPTIPKLRRRAAPRARGVRLDRELGARGRARRVPSAASGSGQILAERGSESADWRLERAPDARALAYERARRGPARCEMEASRRPARSTARGRPRIRGTCDRARRA